MLGLDLLKRIFKSWRSRPRGSRNIATKANQNGKTILNQLGRTYSNSDSPLDLIPATFFGKKERKMEKLRQKRHNNTNQPAWQSVAETLDTEPNFLKITKTNTN